MGVLSKKSNETGRIPVSSKDAQKNLVAIGGIGVFIFVLVIVVAFFIFIYLPSSQNSIPTLPNSTAGNQNTTQNTCDDECLFAKITSEGNVSQCNDLVQNKSDCFEFFSQKDLESCVQISDQTILKECIIHYALEKNDLTLCNNLDGDSKDTCISFIDSCYFKKGDDRALCYALSKNDYNYCAQNVQCIYDYAKSSNREDGCSVLSDPTQVLVCNSLATKSDKCKDALNPSSVNYCYSEWAIQKDDSFYCGMITQKASIPAEDCYSHFAVKEKDPAYCEKVDIVNNFRWSCLTDYAIETGEVAGCEAIEEYVTVSKTNCYLKLAKAINDPRICEYLDDVSAKNQCYVANINIRTDLLTPEKCSGVRSDTWRNRCYLEAGKNANDSTVCNAITSQAEKDFCIGVVEQKIYESE